MFGIRFIKFTWDKNYKIHRKKTEQKIQAQQQLLQTVVDNLPFWIYLENAQHELQVLNMQFLKALGASGQDIKHLNLREIQKRFGIHFADISANERRRLKSGKKLEHEIEFGEPNNKKIFKLVKLPLFKPSGQLQGLLTYAEDITKRHQAEKCLQESETRYRDLFEATFEGLVVLSDRRLIAANEAFGQLMNYPVEEMMGVKLSSFLFPEGYGETGTKLMGDLTELKDKHYQGCLKRKNGDLIPVEVLTRFQEYEGRPVVVMALRDISERKRMEQMVRHFVSMVSHELRTPLTSIAGSLGLLVESASSNFDDGSQELLRIAHQNCERLIRLTDDILDTSRLQSGHMQFHKSNVDLVALLDRATEEMRAYGEKFQVKLQIRRSHKQPCLIYADADRILQVLTNLISNATKFSPRGKTVDIYLKTETEYVSVRVCDRGPGIPAKNSNQVFIPFFQMENVQHKGGSGLGLSISKQIIEHSGGGIHFKSRQGGGAEFYFHLPLVSGDPPDRTKKNKHQVISTESLSNYVPTVNMLHIEN